MNERLVPGLIVALVVLSALLAFALPRALGRERLVEENFALRARLAEVERNLSEVDRILMRLQLYEAQLESLGGVDGGAGPVDIDNAVLRQAAQSLGAPTMASSHATATEWAAALEARSDRTVDWFQTVEPDLTLLVEELESLEALDRALPSFWPAAGFLTSRFGWRRDPLGIQWRHHAGIDIGGQNGDPVWAAGPGTIRQVGRSKSYGKHVVIDHGFGVTTVYAHCSRLFVREGQRVRRGQQVASLGNTGRSTGPHLHFEVRLQDTAVDPLAYLPERRSWVPPWRSPAGD